MPKLSRTFDLTILVAPIIFLAVGISVIYSLVLGTSNDGLALKQGIIALVGLVIFGITAFSDYRFFKATAWIAYLVTLLLLILVNFFGKTANGATNWLDLKIFQLQPSEIAKIALIISLASYFTTIIGKVRWRHIIISFLMILPPVFLVLKEPDLGTAVVIIMIYLTILLAAKLSWDKIAVIISGIAIIFAVLTLSYLNIKPFGQIMADYQRARIAVYIHPDLDIKERGYNVRQAKITVGSGGITGTGFRAGSQIQLQSLPAADTDFIFAGVAETFGFLGSFIFLALYAYFIIRLIEIGALARDNFGMLIVFGIVAMFLTQVTISVGMNLGLLPVTGIPLPFLSSGGTSLLVSFFAVGIAESIYIRHKKITF